MIASPRTPQGTGSLERLSENLFLFRDTCNVYVLRQGASAVLVDFGSGAVLDELPRLGIESVSDVLMTHHHRDQGQGLRRAAENGIRIRVPQAELELFSDIEIHWQSRALDNSYNNRQDRFSLLEPVAIHGTLDDYAVYGFGALEVTVLPTPGHTTGSLTLACHLDGRLRFFTGDLIAGPGKIWSLAATQWTYNGAEGVAATVASLEDLRRRQPDQLLPSHGPVMNEPEAAMWLLSERLRQLLQRRGQYGGLLEKIARPFEHVTEHLLMNRTSHACSYVLLSESGSALLIDYGYDMHVGSPAGSDRASRRPWLYSLPRLKEQFGVERIEVALLTHYHDDHVAGLNLLRRVEGTEVWAAETFAPVLAQPERFDLPCLWFEPVAVDRTLPLESQVRWREYTFTLHHQPGHTRYAVAISFEVDGRRVLAVGDQFEGGYQARWNYVYNNGFTPDDYLAAAELLRREKPDLLLAGHYRPHDVDAAFAEAVAGNARLLRDLHHDLLPVEEFDFEGGDRAVTLDPYRAQVEAGGRLTVTANVRNPSPREEAVTVTLVTPPHWRVDPDRQVAQLAPGESLALAFTVVPAGQAVRRARIAADMTVGEVRLGQQAEALVSVGASKEQNIAWSDERRRAGDR